MLAGCKEELSRTSAELPIIFLLCLVSTVSHQRFEAYQIFAEQNSVCIIYFPSDKTKFPVFPVAKN